MILGRITKLYRPCLLDPTCRRMCHRTERTLQHIRMQMFQKRASASGSVWQKPDIELCTARPIA